MASQSYYDHLFKLVLIGSSGAGKSCLLLRFADDRFTDSYITTIGVDFRFKTLALDVINDQTSMAEKKLVKLQTWDTAGQERFRTITSAYYRGSDGILIVFDLTDRASFGHVEEWLEEVNRFAAEQTIKLLIGNKSDLVDDRQVSQTEAQEKATSLGMKYIETSAKEDSNVSKAFQELSRALVKARDAAGAKAAAEEGSVHGMRLGAGSSVDGGGDGGCGCL